MPIRATVLKFLTAALLPKPNVATKQLAFRSTLTVGFEQQQQKLQRTNVISGEARFHTRLLIGCLEDILIGQAAVSERISPPVRGGGTDVARSLLVEAVVCSRRELATTIFCAAVTTTPTTLAVLIGPEVGCIANCYSIEDIPLVEIGRPAAIGNDAALVPRV